MDPVLLARLQFAATTIYHFFFVPLTLGLSIIVALMETLYVRTNRDIYKQMTKFWGKLFLINFAMGVVTGIVLEFQFGMNWSEYSRFVGDIFGAPLAIEALLAFFLESTFLGVWIFGWDKISKRLHMITMWLVAIGANISALWILIANSWMQEPVGYALENGRAVMTDFFALLFNPHLFVQFPHVLMSGLTTAAFFVLGISAFHLVRRVENRELFRLSFQIGAVVAILATIWVILSGHSQAQHMVQAQPMKMAAAEALWNTEDPAGMSLFTVGNEEELRDVFAIRVPRLLSLLAYNQLEGAVQGLNDLQQQYTAEYGPGDYVPPVAISYWSFRIMVGVGTAMLLLAGYSLFLMLGEQLHNPPRFLRFFPWFIIFPYLANTTGWILTEVGRMPWVVYGLIRVEDAISPNVGAGTILTTLIAFVLIYGALMLADIYLLQKYARKGVSGEPAAVGEEGPIPGLVGD